jgi:hypothetical protein
MGFSECVVALGKEFKARGMDTHVELLRRFWLTWMRAGQPEEWTAADVVDLILDFGLGPDDRHRGGRLRSQPGVHVD